MCTHAALHRALPTAILAALSIGIASSQGTLPAVPTQIPPIDRVFFDIDHEGTHWARGATYKAAFGASGAIYTPFLGSDAPQNYPLRMEVTEASVSGHALVLDAPSVSRDGDRISIDRGSVRSEYVLGVDFVEQLFLIDERPEFAGDLQLRIALDTDLACRPERGGIAFENEWGGTHYGAVTVLDAEGAQLALPIEFDAASITLRVPSSFLSAAAYPIAVDPLITTTSLFSTNSESEFHPDVVWDPQSQRYLVVWEQGFSGSDHDIVSMFATASGIVSNTMAFIDGTSIYARGPQVASVSATQKACVVYSRGFAGSRDIWYGIRDLGTGALGMRGPIANTSLDEFRPDVGGTASTVSADQRFTIVYEVAESSTLHSIELRQVLPSGSPLGVMTTIHRVPNVVANKPVISSSIPAGEIAHNVAWASELPTNFSVSTRQVHAHGFNLHSSSLILDTKVFRLDNPDVSSLGPRVAGETEPGYAVVWQDRVFSGAGIKMALVSDGQLISLQDQERMSNAIPAANQAQPAIACSGEGFALAYAGAPTSPDNHDIYLCGFSVANREFALTERRVVASANALHDETPRVVSHFEVGGTTNSFGPFGVIFTERSNVPGGGTQGDLRLAEFSTSRSSGVQQSVCLLHAEQHGHGVHDQYHRVDHQSLATHRQRSGSPASEHYATDRVEESGFVPDPAWKLGRIVSWRLHWTPGPTGQLGVVWHGRDTAQPAFHRPAQRQRSGRLRRLLVLPALASRYGERAAHVQLLERRQDPLRVVLQSCACVAGRRHPSSPTVDDLQTGTFAPAIHFVW